MKTTALFVNTSRGPVVEENALIRVLKDQRILGAAIDLMVEEPPQPDHPLFALENVLITPHVAGVTFDTWRRRSEIIFQNMQRVWEGNPPLSPIIAE